MATVDETQHFSIWNSDSLIVITTASISIYNSTELLLGILAYFKRWRGLYFWSLVVASTGIIPYFIGFVCEYFQLIVYWLSMTLSTIGWIALVTGQSFVLYSRLGLLLSERNILRAVKWMIIVDAIVFHVSITVVQYGKVYASERDGFTKALFYLEKIQMTGFCVQEFIISGLYLWKTVQMLRVVSKEGTRRVMIELFTINVLIIVMDIALLVLEYSGLRVMERTWKGLVYSVKLKLEFAILGKLVDLVQSSQRTLSNVLGDVSDCVDPSRTVSNADLVGSSPKSPDEEMPAWMAKLEGRGFEHVEHVD